MSDKLNIVTVATCNEWIEYHLRRFVWQAKKTNPKANYYVIIPYSEEEKDAALTWKSVLLPHFTAVVTTRCIDVPGRLMYYDWLRSNVLEAFGLEEALYLDADADIMENLDHIRDIQPDKQLLCVPNTLTMTDVTKTLLQYGLDYSSFPCIDPGFLYFRRSYAAEFNRIRQEHRYNNNDFVPGSSVWNVVIQQAGDAGVLPYTYNVHVVWGWHSLAHAKVIHFCGDLGKVQRKQWDVANHPDNVVIRLTTTVEPDLKWRRT